EDGVYAATRGNTAATALKSALDRLTVYVLAPDLAARGMSDALIEGVRLVDY
ncbi:MAG: sulfurtransferase complex subunit TusB, partial [Rhodocyclales bacterium CG17_big_fil_post_rev_8_21_14_2_50_68_7]